MKSLIQVLILSLAFSVGASCKKKKSAPAIKAPDQEVVDQDPPILPPDGENSNPDAPVTPVAPVTGNWTIITNTNIQYSIEGRSADEVLVIMHPNSPHVLTRIQSTEQDVSLFHKQYIHFYGRIQGNTDLEFRRHNATGACSLKVIDTYASAPRLNNTMYSEGQCL